MTKELPSPELLRKLLRYDPDTGKLFWRERTPDMFPEGKRQNQAHSAWTTKYCGQQALTAKAKGYLVGDISGKTMRAHRVAWAIHYGEWPKAEIDHINGDRADNRISNLRDVSRIVNMRNVELSPKNTSGHNGVHWDRRERKWRARIRINSKLKCLGYFHDINDAVKARKNAEYNLRFTCRHGKARHRPRANQGDGQ
jgi:hypothetical protein